MVILFHYQLNKDTFLLRETEEVSIFKIYVFIFKLCNDIEQKHTHILH